MRCSYIAHAHNQYRHAGVAYLGKTRISQWQLTNVSARSGKVGIDDRGRSNRRNTGLVYAT